MTGAVPLRAVLLSAVTADETFSVPVNCLGYRDLTTYVISDGTVSGGSVTMQEATYDPQVPGGTGGYADTWATIGSAITPVTDSVVATHHTAGAYHWVRARIDTAIAGGATVTVVLIGNPS